MDKILQQLRKLTQLVRDQKEFVVLKDSKTDNYHDLPFLNIAKILSTITQSNIYIVDSEGVVVGYDEIYTMNSERVDDYLKEKQFPQEYIENLERLKSSSENIGVEEDYTMFPIEYKEKFGDGVTTIIPIFVSGKRLGSLILARVGRLFEVGDLILAEYSATVVGMELLKYVNHKEQLIYHEKERVKLAWHSLSYSEKQAVEYIFKDMSEMTNIIKATQIAKEHNLTRSIIVNAIRKLESSGVLESHSLGVKGTFIKLNSQSVLDYLKTFER